MQIKIFRINTGSCGGCDAEIVAAIEAHADLAWAEVAERADVLLLTGPLTQSSRPALQALLAELGDQPPLLAVGRCAIDGHPFGRGGVAELPGLDAETLDGCPPTPTEIAAAIRRVAMDRMTR